MDSHTHKKQRLKESADASGQAKAPHQAHTTKHAPSRTASRSTDILPGPSKKTKPFSHNAPKRLAVASSSKVTTAKPPSKGPHPAVPNGRPPVPILFDPIRRHRMAIAGASSAPQRAPAQSAVAAYKQTLKNRASDSSPHVYGYDDVHSTAHAHFPPNDPRVAPATFSVNPSTSEPVSPSLQTEPMTNSNTVASALLLDNDDSSSVFNPAMPSTSTAEAHTFVTSSSASASNANGNSSLEAVAQTLKDSTTWTTPIGYRTLKLPVPLPLTQSKTVVPDTQIQEEGSGSCSDGEEKECYKQKQSEDMPKDKGKGKTVEQLDVNDGDLSNILSPEVEAADATNPLGIDMNEDVGKDEDENEEMDEGEAEEEPVLPAAFRNLFRRSSSEEVEEAKDMEDGSEEEEEEEEGEETQRESLRSRQESTSFDLQPEVDEMEERGSDQNSEEEEEEEEVDGEEMHQEEREEDAHMDVDISHTQAPTSNPVQAPTEAAPAIVAAIARLEENLRTMRAELAAKREEERLEWERRDREQAEAILEKEREKKEELERERGRAEEREKLLEVQRVLEIGREKERVRKEERKRAREDELARELERERERVREEEREKAREAEREREVEREKEREKERERQRALERELEMERERVREEEHKKSLEAERVREKEREQERERERVREEERKKERQVEKEREKQREIEREQERARKLHQMLEQQRQQKQAQAQAQIAAAAPTPLVFPPEMEERIAQRVLEALQPALERMRVEREAETMREQEERAVEIAREIEDRLLERTVEKAEEREEREREKAKEKAEREAEKAKEKAEKAAEEREKEARAEKEKEALHRWRAVEMEGLRAEKTKEHDEQMRREKEREERDILRFAELERLTAEREDRHEKECEQERQRLLESERRAVELEAQREAQHKQEREVQKNQDEARDKADVDMYKALGILADRVDVVLNVLGVRGDRGASAAGGSIVTPAEDTSFAAIGRKRRRLALGAQDIQVGTNASVEVIDVDMDEMPQSYAGAEEKSVLERLTSVEMDLQECLERLRDPLAGFNVEMQALAQAQSQAGKKVSDALASAEDSPPVTRHEMGTSPFRDTDANRTRKRKLLWGVAEEDDELVERRNDKLEAEFLQQKAHNLEIEKQLKDMMNRMVNLSKLISKNSQDSQNQNIEMNEKFKDMMDRIASISSALDAKLTPRAHVSSHPQPNYDSADKIDDHEGPLEQVQDEVDVFGPLVANSSPNGAHGPSPADKNILPETEDVGKGAASLDSGREDDTRGVDVPGEGTVSDTDNGKERELEGEADVEMDDAVREDKEKSMNDVRLGFQDESSLPQLQSTPRCDVSLDHALHSNVAPRMNSRLESRSKSRSKSTTSQFSPVDWSKTSSATRERSLVLKLSPNAKLILGTPSAVQRSVSDPTNSTTNTPSKMSDPSSSLGSKPFPVTPPHMMATNRSYTLPPPMEGSIAALRKVSLGTAYTDAYVYGDVLSKDRMSAGMGAEDTRDDQVDMVMGADAGERMLSPESEEEREERKEKRDHVVKKQQDNARFGLDSAVSKSLPGALTVERTMSSTSSLSTLTSVPSTSSASSVPVSTLVHDLGPSSPSVSLAVDLQNVKIGPPSKKLRLESTSPPKPSTSVVTLSVSHTSSTTTLSSTAPFLCSQTTEEDEAAVHSLVMVGSQDQEELDAENDSMATVEGMVDHIQESTPIPATPQRMDRDEIIPSSCSPPVVDKGKGKAVDTYFNDENMGSDDGRMEQPPLAQSEHFRSPSSPLFTSPSQHSSYGDDPSYNDEDIMDTSTPSRSQSKIAAGSSKLSSDGNSETRRIVKAKRELNSPISVPPPKENVDPAHDYDYISSATPSPINPAKSSQARAATLKASTSKPPSNEVVVIDFDSPPPTSFKRTSPAKPKQKLRKKGERSSTSTSVISISSGSEDEVPKATQKSISSQQPKSATLEQRLRMRPRPIPVNRRKSAAKIEIFSPPPTEIVDLTTPVKNGSTAVTGSRRRGFSTPPAPVASTSKFKVDAKKPVEKPPVKDKLPQKAPEPEAAPQPTPEEYYSSPLSSEESSADEALPPPAPESSFDPEKYSARLAEDDSDSDADVIRVKKKNTAVQKTPAASTSGRRSTSSAGGVGVKLDPDSVDSMDTISAAGARKPPTRIGELLAAKSKNQSAARTRVKKRKLPSATNDADDEETKRNEPPLKRAKARAVAAVSASASASEKEKGKPASKAKGIRSESLKNKEKIKEEGPSARYPLRSPRKEQSIGSISASLTTPRKKRAQGVVWPKIDGPRFDLFVKCDSCYLWYHIGCVGMGPDDVRLRATERYECPICTSGIPKDESPSKKVYDEDVKGTDACARRYCLSTYVNRRSKAGKSQATDDSSFVVESLVGRYKKVTGGLGISYVYLVKWLNYGYDEATVQTIESMGMSNPGPLLEAFEKQAAAEGIDLENASDTVLLREALEGGWTDDMVFVKPE